MPVNKPARISSKQISGDEQKESSLLERASGAFGLHRLKPAAVPEELKELEAKKSAPASRTDEATGASQVLDTPKRRASDFIGQPATTPGSTAPSKMEAERPAISFSGTPQEIVRLLLREQGLIDPDGGASTLLEEFRIIKRQVLTSAKADGSQSSRRVLVCSPHSNEGKTFCALNLAIALAGERDAEVLLIDADFGKPSIMTKLGLEAGRGFMDVLSDPTAQVEDHVVTTDIPGLYVLPAGSRTGRDSEYLASERTWEVLNRITRGAPKRIVVFDSPPALAATPAAELAKHAGQALLVARADMTGRAALEDAIDLLSSCPDIKLLLNDATFSPSGRKFGSYYGYGE